MTVWQNCIIHYGLQIVISSFDNGKRIKISFYSSRFWSSLKHFLVLLDVKLTKTQNFWALISSRDPYLLKMSSLFRSENSEKHISPTVVPQGGRIFLSDISVPLLEVNFACPAFHSIVVLFFSVLMARLHLFSSLRLPVLFLCSDLYFVVEK